MVVRDDEDLAVDDMSTSKPERPGSQRAAPAVHAIGLGDAPGASARERLERADAMRSELVADRRALPTGQLARLTAARRGRAHAEAQRAVLTARIERLPEPPAPKRFRDVPTRTWQNGAGCVRPRSTTSPSSRCRRRPAGPSRSSASGPRIRGQPTRGTRRCGASSGHGCRRTPRRRSTGSARHRRIATPVRHGLRPRSSSSAAASRCSVTATMNPPGLQGPPCSWRSSTGNRAVGGVASVGYRP